MSIPELPDGWLSDAEVKELRRLARNKEVLELGAWKGRSTVAMSSVARYIVSVDRHHGIPLAQEDGDSLPDYLDAVRELENVAIVIGGFHEVVPRFGSNFDLVFVDGDHDADSAEADALLAFAHVNEHGVVAFHDWDFESVQAGVSRVTGAVKPWRVVDSVASFHMRSFG